MAYLQLIPQRCSKIVWIVAFRVPSTFDSVFVREVTIVGIVCEIRTVIERHQRLIVVVVTSDSFEHSKFRMKRFEQLICLFTDSRESFRLISSFVWSTVWPSQKDSEWHCLHLRRRWIFFARHHPHSSFFPIGDVIKDVGIDMRITNRWSGLAIRFYGALTCSAASFTYIIVA